MRYLGLLLCAAGIASVHAAGPTPNDSVLHSYESCSFPDGLQVAQIDSLPPGPQSRTVNTATGPRDIHMLAGRRIIFAYGLAGDGFANVKPEVLPAGTWDVQKATLLDAMQVMLSADHEEIPNTTLPQSHGLEMHGFDRAELKGNVLGFYLLFDNQRHVATSVYFLNQDPFTRRFSTIGQYRELRTNFLARYTNCIAQNRALESAAQKAAP